MIAAAVKAARKLLRPSWATGAMDTGLLPAGTVLLDVVIPERAVPWKAPTTTRRGVSFKDKRLVAWQETVHEWATLNRTLPGLYWGPVEVRMWACFSGGQLPDCCNLLKAAEDAMQGVVFENDRQVLRDSAERPWDYAVHDAARIVVAAIFPSTLVFDWEAKHGSPVA